MKTYSIIFLLTASCSVVFGQKINYNLKGGYIANGYDVVSYFSDSPMKGKKEFVYQYEDIKLKFSNQSNLDLFQSEPEKYLPQYGGWCAYALGTNGEKVKINPKTYDIIDGKLYLFYNSWGTNTLKSWKKEGPNELKQKADKNWGQIKYMNN